MSMTTTMSKMMTTITMATTMTVKTLREILEKIGV